MQYLGSLCSRSSDPQPRYQLEPRLYAVSRVRVAMDIFRKIAADRHLERLS